MTKVHRVDVETREVDWSDDHPLNQRGTFRSEVTKLFHVCDHPCLWGCP